MNSLSLKFENCYGIKSLNHVFNFSLFKAYSIYAPNGFMKTSFSKAFKDLSEGKASVDLVFTDRITTRDIKDEVGADIQSKNVFVIEPYNEDYDSKKISLLLVNSVLKQEYDSAVSQMEEKKNAFLKRLKQLSGLTGKTITPEKEIEKIFGKKSFYEFLNFIEDKIADINDNRLSLLSYAELFNEKTISLLQSGKINQQLNDYIEKYNELVSASPILNDKFNHYHAKAINKSLGDNGFFKAKHSVNLFNGVDKEEITSQSDLNKKIEEEKCRILTDKVLSDRFEDIDKKLSNAELRDFRDYLFQHQDIVIELSDYKKFQMDIWFAYFNSEYQLVSDLILEYKSGKVVIENAIGQARQEETAWKEVVEIFNRRFSVPFRLEVSNQEDVILHGTSPQVKFTFVERSIEKSISRGDLLKVLSQGEKRALYILNILFEINARIKGEEKTILIVDDIADSFDYKNKYAIIEYLKEISENEKFYCLFLSHNFDFYRNISGRLRSSRDNKLFAVKNDSVLTFVKEKYQNNPFDFWKKHLDTPRYIVSSIPFVRNLAEYCGYEDEYLQLTSLLHIKSDSNNILISDLEVIYKLILKDKSLLDLPDQTKSVLSLIFEQSDEISLELDEAAELESKIILSISIRLLAEQYMVSKVTDKFFISSIKSNQTRVLLDKFKEEFHDHFDEIKLLEQVNLMTPEGIHINSFMYEPILDMSSRHLKDLYEAVKTLHCPAARPVLTI